MSRSTDSPRMTRAVSHETAGREEVIKCVIVGDCGVGKTKLVCARACRTTYTLSELVTQARTPTIWAIDHYSRDEEIVEQARCMVDGTPVHLRLWDTFGYHDKDRKFAYDGADVIVICFSLVRPRTLANVQAMWYPEACRLCPGVPIIVVGCQADLRYVHLDRTFQTMEKSYFFCEITPKDVIDPETGRAAAGALGLPYYETSVLTGFGVGCAFDNAIRAALLHRGQGLLGQHFKNVQGPLPQKPECPPQPEPPLVRAPQSAAVTDLSSWLQCSSSLSDSGSSIEPYVNSVAAATLHSTDTVDGLLSDVTFECRIGGGRGGGIALYHCHRIVVCAGSPALKSLLCDTSAVASVSTASAAVLQRVFRVAARSRPQLSQPWQSSTGGRLRVSVDGSVDAATFASFLHFLYTGQLDLTGTALADQLPECRRPCNVAHLAAMAELLCVPELVVVCNEILASTDLSWPSQTKSQQESQQRYVERRSAAFREIGIRERLFTDVIFQLDDGCLPAHRVLLAAQCDVMSAMFCSCFRDSSSRNVPVRDVSVATFAALLDVLYSGRCVIDMKPSGYAELAVLANLLCLPSVVACAEEACVRKLMTMHSLGHDTVALALAILELAELHNALQLADWCRHHLSVNYVTCFNRHHEELRKLSPSNQEALAQHRWPPLWYLRELDHYEKRERALQLAAAELDLTSIGCLCFALRNRKQQRRLAISLEDSNAADQPRGLATTG